MSAVALGAAALARPAEACSLPIAPDFEPPPGLTRLEQQRWRHKKVAASKRDDEIWLQPRLWQNADAVMVAPGEARSETTIEASGEIMRVRDVELVPVRRLKGAGAPDMFRIGPPGKE